MEAWAVPYVETAQGKTVADAFMYLKTEHHPQ